MGLAGLVRLEAEAKNSSEKERMREVRGAEMRSVDVSVGCGKLVCMKLSRGGLRRGEMERRGEEGGLPMHVVPKMLSIWSGGMESVGWD